MTGSALAPIIIPIVVVIALAAWLAMIFYADAHPGRVRHSAAAGPATAHGDELAPTGAGASRRTAVPAANRTGEQAPSQPTRRAA